MRRRTLSSEGAPGSAISTNLMPVKVCKHCKQKLFASTLSIPPDSIGAACLASSCSEWNVEPTLKYSLLLSLGSVGSRFLWNTNVPARLTMYSDSSISLRPNRGTRVQPSGSAIGHLASTTLQSSNLRALGLVSPGQGESWFGKGKHAAAPPHIYNRSSQQII